MSIVKFNVAQLLREMIGSRRDYEFSEVALPLDETLVLRELQGNVRFTRTATGVFAQVEAQGQVRLTCVRSLEEFEQPVEVSFSDQFHSVIDVMNGASLPMPAEDDPYLLTDLHMADIGDAIREYTLLALPLNPISPAYRDNPVSYTVGSDETEENPVGENPIEATSADLEALKAWAARQNSKHRL